MTNNICSLIKKNQAFTLKHPINCNMQALTLNEQAALVAYASLCQRSPLASKSIANSLALLERSAVKNTPAAHTRSSSSAKSARFKGEKLLPSFFKPSQNSVICGRGKRCYASVGNLKLREVVLLCLPKYSKATTKKEKTEIVTAVMDHILDSCPGRIGAFIKSDDLGRWYEVGEQVARERISSIFRDFLHPVYRSSSRSRVNRRKQTREMKTSRVEESD